MKNLLIEMLKSSTPYTYKITRAIVENDLKHFQTLTTKYLFTVVAKKCDVGYSLSGWSPITMEELVSTTNTGLKFYNIYIYKYVLLF